MDNKEEEKELAAASPEASPEKGAPANYQPPKFRSFPEIENHFSNKGKNFIENHVTNELWLATEKLHGTNFCFIHDGVKLTCCKRTSVLSDDMNFFHY